MSPSYSTILCFCSICLLSIGCAKEKPQQANELVYTYSELVPQVYADLPVLYQHPLPPRAALESIVVPEGFRVELFAAEPDVINPIAINWDERGRLWVIESLDYPHGEEGFNSRIKILEDTDHDGVADQVTVFADGLKMATGLTFSKGGVIVAQAPDFLFLRDNNGDDIADEKKIINTGWRTYDTHAGPSNLKYGFDNKIWGAVGYAGYNEGGGNNITFSQGIFRMNSDGTDLEPYAMFSNNTWGLGFNEYFDVFGSTANNAHAIHAAAPIGLYQNTPALRYGAARNISGHYEVNSLVKNLRQVDVRGGFTAAAGFSIYTARSFPEKYWNRNAFVCEPTAGVVHTAILQQDGVSFQEQDGGNILASADEWFSPVHAEVGPDGALWVADWYSFIVQHNPTPKGFETGSGDAYVSALRDKERGRIYRVIYDGAEKVKYPNLTSGDLQSLINGLQNNNLFWRLQAQRLLVESKSNDAIPVILDAIDKSQEELFLIHLLWSLRGLTPIEELPKSQQQKLYNLLDHSSIPVQRTALQILPANELTQEAILMRDLLSDTVPTIRLAAIIKSCSLPPSKDIATVLVGESKKAENFRNPLIAEVLYLALDHNFKHIQYLIEREHPSNPQARKIGLEAGWHTTNYNHDLWPAIRSGLPFEHQGIEELNPFNGVIWYRKSFVVPEGFSEGQAILHLGPIDNSDICWINGVKIGETFELWSQPRNYTIPAGLLHPGKNVIAVRVEDPRDVGGLTGKNLSIERSTQSSLPLDEHWQYQIERRFGDKFVFDTPEGLLDFLLNTNSSPSTNNPAPPPTRKAIEIKPIPNSLRYDIDTIRANAGELLSISLNNTDQMPHNLVIGKPGSLSVIGAASEKEMGNDNFVPDIEAVLYSTPIVNPGKTETLTFIAPAKKGNYVYLCTYPGHWRTMNGIIIVE